MASGGDYLDEIKLELQKGRKQWKLGYKVLEAFGYSRRRQTVLDLINAELGKRDMYTKPEVGPEMPLEKGIGFYLKGRPEPALEAEPIDPDEPSETFELAPEVEGEAGHVVTVAIQPPVSPEQPVDKLPVVGSLDSAYAAPVVVAPTDSVSKALTIMARYGYSQLVVVSGQNTVRGLISYRSIAKAQMYGKPESVSDCMEASPPQVDINESLARVIEHLGHSDIVLVRVNGQLSGIVTSYDLALEYEKTAGPILLIGQIEDELRWIVRKLDLATALARTGNRPESAPKSVKDTTMGDLHRILSHPENWAEVGLVYDRHTFCAYLDTVRELRNAAMHFRESDVTDTDVLKMFAEMVRDAYIASLKS